MKKLLTTLLFGSFFSACAERQPVPAIPSDPEIEGKIEKLLKGMTLEEKIGQMCELTIGAVTDKNDNKLSEALLDTVIGKYKVGSLLNIPFGVSQKKEVFAEVITQIQKKSLEEIGIPCIYGLDQIHGASYTQDATYFPQGINMAAAFNRELTRHCAEITAYETRACCVPWTFAPVMDLGRDPRWPRMWESFGEDTYVNAQMAVQAVRGLQGDNPNKVDEYHISSCIKHFMGYGVPVSGKDRTPSSITDIDMREKYFAPFKAAIRAGALSLMVNSANNSGVAFHANKELLTGWLKEDLNWDGMIVTDWNDINNLYFRDHIASSKKDAVRLAVNAGIDMAMIPSEGQFCIDLKELVEEGAVSMERIDDAVRRVLRLKFRLGLFENPYWDIRKYDKFGSREFAEVALQAARESEVLLKNEGKTFAHEVDKAGYHRSDVAMLMQQNAGELVKYIRSSELAEDETQTVSYQISYRALGLKNAYMPYFSDSQTAGGKVWLRDDTVVCKKRATGKVSFEGLDENTDLRDVFDRFCMVNGETDTDLQQWYDAYADSRYRKFATDVPAVGDFITRRLALESIGYGVYEENGTYVADQMETGGLYDEDWLADTDGNNSGRAERQITTNNIRQNLATQVANWLGNENTYNLYLNHIPQGKDTIAYFL